MQRQVITWFLYCLHLEEGEYGISPQLNPEQRLAHRWYAPLPVLKAASVGLNLTTFIMRISRSSGELRAGLCETVTGRELCLNELQPEIQSALVHT
ncbi:MAG: hypothetical protein HY422_01695, partial [Candidatus Komeilibacteria bacterium]|nr:hypothetical protein [Candidatus Komeilibacteria bacterium]